MGWRSPSSPRYVAPSGVGVRRPELEDVADLDAVAQDDRFAAVRARVALADVRDVGDDVGA